MKKKILSRKSNENEKYSSSLRIKKKQSFSEKYTVDLGVMFPSIDLHGHIFHTISILSGSKNPYFREKKLSSFSRYPTGSEKHRPAYSMR